MDDLSIADLQPKDVDAARKLILAGLEEHWGWLDSSLNPDLNDILHSYAGETFLAAWQHGELIGAGALVREEEGVGRIVRMSVTSSARRKGIGRAILRELCLRARARGFQRLVLETTQTWTDAVEFYQSFGFQITGYRDGDIHFVMDCPEA